jgi:hypothetical protein
VVILLLGVVLDVVWKGRRDRAVTRMTAGARTL